MITSRLTKAWKRPIKEVFCKFGITILLVTTLLPYALSNGGNS